MKTMNDLIKREDAIDTIWDYWKMRIDVLPMDAKDYSRTKAAFLEHNAALRSAIKDVPCVDRSQGKWTRHYTNLICSECEGLVVGYIAHQEPPYCPYCGSRMKGAKDE